MSTIDEQEQMIMDCEARESKLSDWERQFIDSVSKAETLTDKQAAKLEQIWERVTE